MFRELNTLINNEIAEQDLDNFSVIIGSNPSQGARSPLLWNKVYKEEKNNTLMLPLDVSEDRLPDLITFLQENKKCLGGAISVPYKEKIFALLKEKLPKDITDIGAINCFYREKDSKYFFTGTNTDGEASLESINEFLEETKNKNIHLIGYGGAGKAILAFLLKKFNSTHSIKVFNRSIPSNASITSKKNIFHNLEDFKNFSGNSDIIINATTLGSGNLSEKTPIEKSTLEICSSKTIVFDIIYSPLKTKLLQEADSLGLKTINGLRMNLIQAVLAFSYTNNTDLSTERIFEIMSSI
ncbi:hypothetical protein OA385_01335 [Paracoccaceae bacterium]|nr:hypothetical protein [Paracoccaceae bacterium]